MKKITLTSLSIMGAMSISSVAIADAGWSGFYGGLSVGYQDALVKNDGYTLNYFGITGTPHPSGATGGGFGGYNFQVPGQNFLVGAEAAVDFGGHRDRKGPNGFGISGNAHVSSQASFKARIGYTAKAGFLPWFQAGVIAGRTEYDVTSTGGPFAGNHGMKTALGVTTGVGLDYAFHGPLFARISYSYSHLGKENFFRNQPGEAFDLNDFKVGIGYKF